MCISNSKKQHKLKITFSIDFLNVYIWPNLTPLKMRKLLFILSCFIFFTTFSQNKTISIGILADKTSPQTQPLLEELKKEIRAVAGQNRTINFAEVLENNYNLEIAKANYQALSNTKTDIILAFGVVNNVAIYQLQKYEKPTIVFGNVNSDFIKLPENQKTSEIDNITYILVPSSYKKDLEALKALYDYKKVGIVVDTYLPNALPIKELFDTYFKDKPADYSLIQLPENGTIESELGDIDAVYVAGGFSLTDTQFEIMVTDINSKKLPSFSSNGVQDVKRGILSTNQPEANISQFFRRIALNVESIISGVNASELPLFIDYKDKTTLNINTAKEIGFPLRYSMIATADFIGTDNITTAETSLSILDIMKGVIDKNLSLQVEKKNVDLSAQDTKFAKSNYLPDVTASTDGIYIDPKVAEIAGGINPEFSTSGNVIAKQLLYSENASANVTIQKELQKAQQEVYNSAELDALLNASVAYFNALILKTNANIQNQNLLITKKNLELAQQNFEGGASGKSDVLRFRSQLAQNSQSLIEAGNQLKQSFNTINQLLNNKISKVIDVQDAELSKGVFKQYNYNDFFELLDNPKLQPYLIEFLVEEAKKNAPELKNIGYNLNAIERNYRLNNTGRFIPTVALQGQYSLAISQSGKGSTFPVGSPLVPDGTYNVGLNISLPIFQQNQRNINRQTAKIQENQLLVQQDNTYLNIEKNVNDLILDIVNQIANIQISKVSQSTAKEALDLTQNAYESGAVPIIQLIDAQSNYLQSQLASATANYNYLISSMQLERAIGYFFLMHTEAENKAFTQRAQQYILNKN